MSNEVMTRNSEWMNHIVNHLNRMVDNFERAVMNYRPMLGGERFMTDKELQSFALPTELPSHNVDNIILIKLLINTTVLTGFEPVISCVTGRRDNPYTIGPFVFSGGYRARTCDPLLVRQTLSQLS